MQFDQPIPLSRRHLGLQLLHVPSDVPGLEYELARSAALEAPFFGGMVIHTNSHGMRGREVALEKAPGTFRIAMVGDSVTFGHGVTDEECISAQLQDRLDRYLGAGRFEVLNFGVSGYSTQDEARLIEDRVLDFDPDVLVLNYVFNDPEPHPHHALHRAFHRYGWLDHLQVLRRIRQALYERAETRAGGNLQMLHDPAGPYWPTAVDGFERIRAACATAGVPVVVTIMPILGGRTWGNYSLGPFHEQVAALARAKGFLVCDLLSALRRGGPVPDELHVGDGHPNAEGSRLVALEVGLFLQTSFPQAFAPSPGARPESGR